MRAYHYEFDEKNNLLTSRPRHDWSSHSSSAFIYALIAETEQVEGLVNISFKTYVPKQFRPKKDKSDSEWW